MTTRRIALTILLIPALSLGAGWVSWPYLFEENIDEARVAALEHVDTLRDEQLKAEIREQISSLFYMKDLARSLSGRSYRARYIDDPTVILRQIPDPHEQARAWWEGTFFDSRPDVDDAVLALSSHSPLSRNSEPQFPYSLEWHSATLDNGQVLEATYDVSIRPEGIGLHASRYSNRIELIYPKDLESQPAPVTMHGEAKSAIPHRIMLFRFSKDDAGITQRDGNLSVKLLSVGENYAEIEVTNRLLPAESLPDWAHKPFEIHAQDQTNRYLALLGSIKVDRAEMRLYERQLQAALRQKSYSERFFNEQRSERLAFKRNQRKYYGKIYFKGQVDSISVIALDLSEVTIWEHTLAAPVYQLESQVKSLDLRRYPAPTIIHDASLESYLSDYNISEEEQRQRIKLYQHAESSRTALIQFDNGAPFNWHVGGSTSSNRINFYSRNESGARELIEGIDKYAFRISILNQNIRYNLPSFSTNQRPAFASGTMPLVRPVVKRFEYAAGLLPEHLELKDNALLIRLHGFPEKRWRFYAKDADGKYLVRMFDATHLGDDSKPVYKALYFYGQPASIDAYLLSAVHRLDYDFDIELREPEYPCYASAGINMGGCL